MDKKSLLAVLLITVIVIIWMVIMSVNQEPPPDLPERSAVNTQTQGDSSAPNNESRDYPDAIKGDAAVYDSVAQANDEQKYVLAFGKSFAHKAQGKEQIITVENEVIKAFISTKGGVLKKWYLKDFKSWNQYTTQLVASRIGVLGIKLSSRETGDDVDTRELYFELDGNAQYNYTISGDRTAEFSMKLEIAPGKSIIRTYKFYGDKYHFDTDISVNNFDDILTNKGYKFEWVRGLVYQEQNSVDESNEGESQMSWNGEIITLDASEYSVVKEQKTGIIDYAAVKSKYFTAAIIPKPDKSYDGTVTLSGKRFGAPDNGMQERYDISYLIPYRGGSQTKSFQVYIGPVDYDILSEYKLQNLVNLGWKWVIRPISEFFMLPFFLFIYKIIGNYGVSIILFGLVMKIILHPLSIQQMRSARKMQIIAPEIAKVREANKDDQKKQQAELMKVYSTYGINPAGGCLPLLLQMPILYALWSVLRTSIDLRQADFMLWIHDLSLPDSIVTLPFPIFGIESISGLALLMGITLFIQQKMTLTDPKQKALVYMMPIMFTLMFSYFPSGLNLYYFVFNLVGILQQVYMNKFSKKKITLADLKASPKKEGWMAKKMREAQEMAASQGKSLPGQQQQRNPNQRKKKRK